MKNYYFSTEQVLFDKNKNKIWHLLKACQWSKNIPVEYIERFIKYSLCFGAFNKNTSQLMGFARVISDYTTYAYICDVVVEPENRGKGLGNDLVEVIISHSDLQGLKTWMLRTTEEARALYKKHGFQAVKCPETLMEIDDLEVYSKLDFVNLYKK